MAGTNTEIRSKSRDRRKTPECLLNEGGSVEMSKMNWFGKADVFWQAETPSFAPDGSTMKPHSIGTLKDGKLIGLQPFDQGEYDKAFKDVDKKK